MQFLKLLERSLPEKVEVDSIIFTEKGNIYVNKKDGTLISVGGSGGSSGGGGASSMDYIEIVEELPNVANDGDIKIYVKDGYPLISVFYNNYWYSSGMIKHKVKGFVTAEMIKEANPQTDGLVLTVTQDESISDFTSYINVSHQIASATRWVYFDFTCDEGMLRIPWQVGTESGYDYGYVTIDGTTVLSKSGVGSGTHYMKIAAGTHKVGLGFKGDGSNWTNGNFFRIWGIEYLVLPTQVKSVEPPTGGAIGQGLQVVTTLPVNPEENTCYMYIPNEETPKLAVYAHSTWYSQKLELWGDSLDMKSKYKILFVLDKPTSTDKDATVSTLSNFGHIVDLMSTADYSVDIAVDYDLVLFSNFNLSNIALVDQTYTAGHNVLIGYLVGAGSTPCGVDTLGIAESAVGVNAETNYYRGMLSDNPIVDDLPLGTPVLAMAASNWAMQIGNPWVGKVLATRDLDATQVLILAIEAGEVSIKEKLFPKRLVVYGTAHGRGGYTAANGIMLDRAVRWIIQGNALLA